LSFGIATGAFTEERDDWERAIAKADLDLYAPLLERCPGVPWILEAELA
jgi:hypothetical protein